MSREYKIYHHFGECDDLVLDTIKKYPEYYGTFEENDKLNCNFYDIVEEQYLVGFFASAYWYNSGHFECVLCYVWVDEQCRRKGIFNKIVEYVKKHCSKGCEYLTIWADPNNEVANTIYKKKFKFVRYDEEYKQNLYFIKEKKQ